MNLKLAVGAAAMCGLASLVVSVPAKSTQDESRDKKESTRTLTGCLSSSDRNGEYKLTASDGSVWEIRSNEVELGRHLGHTVKVTGKVWHADAHGAKEKTKEAVDPNATEHGHLNVSELSMVSDACQR